MKEWNLIFDIMYSYIFFENIVRLIYITGGCSNLKGVHQNNINWQRMNNNLILVWSWQWQTIPSIYYRKLNNDIDNLKIYYFVWLEHYVFCSNHFYNKRNKTIIILIYPIQFIFRHNLFHYYRTYNFYWLYKLLIQIMGLHSFVMVFIRNLCTFLWGI